MMARSPNRSSVHATTSRMALIKLHDASTPSIENKTNACSTAGSAGTPFNSTMSTSELR